MEQQYLNEFHMHNSQACLRDQRSCAQRPLSVEDVLAQSRRQGRSSIRVISKDGAYEPMGAEDMMER